MKFLKFLAAASVMLGAAGTANASAVLLNTWTAESYPSVSGFGAGNWNVAPDGSSVTQTVNGQPTVFYSDFNAQGTAISGNITVLPGAPDDDFIGFVLGYNAGDTLNSSADYLLIDWKRGTQTFNFGPPAGSTPGGTAPAGLAVSRVTGTPNADEFWQHTDFDVDAGGGLEELARGSTLGSTGWVAGTNYEFTFDFGPNNLQVFVNGTKEIDILGNFNDGRVGFYNFSQAQVEYSAFTVESGTFPAVPEPGTWLMMIMGFGMIGGVLRTRPKRALSVRAA